MEAKKRKRSKNFSEEEKSYLLDIVKQYVSVIENKKTDNVTVGEKKKVWDVICRNYNSVATTGERLPSQLIALYEELKRKAKKNLAEDKVSLKKIL